MSVWSESLERLFKKSAEHFLCLRWVHDDAQRFTANWNTRLTIPVIVLSGLAGLGSVGADNILPFTGADVLIGLISFTAGTLQTISAYFAFAKRSEAHRIAALSYEKLHRLIDFQLKIDREHRIPPDELLRSLQEQTDRLNEASPQLPFYTIQNFKRTFPAAEVSIPSLLNGLEPVEILEAALKPAAKPKVTVLAV